LVVAKVAVGERSLGATKDAGGGRDGNGCCDLVLTTNVGEDAEDRGRRWLAAVVELMEGGVAGTLRPISGETVGFQVARGPSGVSA